MDLHHPVEVLRGMSAPIETNKISVLVTDMFPSSSSRHVVGCFVINSCISAMYLGQRRLYFCDPMQRTAYLVHLQIPDREQDQHFWMLQQITRWFQSGGGNSSLTLTKH